ncbi:MAG: RHS repeat-associated core domain-containing protein [Paludibacteraceae bacterium]
MIYDKANRLVLSQDGNQRIKPQWTITKYDVFGRILYTGTIEREIEESEKAIVHNNVVIEERGTGNELEDTGYTCNTFIDEVVPLTVNYYDNYGFIYDDNLEYQQKDGYSTQYTPPSGGRGEIGLLTGTRTYLLDGSGDYIVSAMYYDYRGNVVQTRSTNHLGGYDITYNDLDFTGKPNKTLKEHGIGGQERAIVGGGIVYEPSVFEFYTYYYDHAGRVTKTEYKLNDKATVVLSDMTDGGYDELGRLKTKKRHNATDTESFEYNIRNWTTKITSGAFEENLYYNTSVPNNPTAQPVYNGNISASTWTYNGKINGYTYYYDQLNRLASTYSILDNQWADGYYTENFSYDKMGNIIYLSRLSNLDYYDLDHLFFTYNGNQIKKITDMNGSGALYNLKEYQDLANQQTEFFYDANGNLITDLDREITEIQYNILNLPDKTIFANGNEIQNLYDAGGRKLKSRYLTKEPLVVAPGSNSNPGIPIRNTLLYTGTETNYIGNMEYDSEIEIYSMIMMQPVYTLARIYNPEGYVTAVTNPQYFYFRKDHLGNNREVWGAAYSYKNPRYGTINHFPALTLQRTQYYPSGLPWAEGEGQDVQNKKYNGKEWVEAHGLDEYYSQARNYYAAIGRPLTIDPLAEKYYSISPYAWCGGNPVNRIDPNGLEWFYYSVDGKADPTWNWRDEHEYHTGVKDTKGKEVVLTGTEAVVVFNGSRQEGLGTKDGKDGYINGEGAVTASVTVYGPDGADDIHNYTGYTMSSNGKNAIDEGIYNGNYDIKGKGGILKSNWTLEHRGRVRMMDGNINPNIPSQIDENGDGYKTGIFIHSSNKSGFAGGRISTGCLLIAPNNWSDFNQTMSGVQNFKVQVIRTQVEKIPLQGITGTVPNLFILQKTIKF